MFGYSAINSFGWALHDDRTLTFPMILSWVGIFLLLPLVVDAAPRSGEGSDPR